MTYLLGPRAHWLGQTAHLLGFLDQPAITKGGISGLYHVLLCTDKILEQQLCETVNRLFDLNAISLVIFGISTTPDVSHQPQQPDTISIQTQQADRGFKKRVSCSMCPSIARTQDRMCPSGSYYTIRAYCCRGSAQLGAGHQWTQCTLNRTWSLSRYWCGPNPKVFWPDYDLCCWQQHVKYMYIIL
jgi:hypothetical protein